MKKLGILLAFIAAGSSLHVAAQQEQPALKGIWQQVVMEHREGGHPHFNMVPVWKVIHSDGTFDTFLVVNSEGFALKAYEGTYTVTSDSTYTEVVTATSADSTLIGKDNVMHYRFLSPDMVFVYYQEAGADDVTHEAWRRVGFDMPRFPGRHGNGPGRGPRPPRDGKGNPAEFREKAEKQAEQQQQQLRQSGNVGGSDADDDDF